MTTPPMDARVRRKQLALALGLLTALAIMAVLFGEPVSAAVGLGAAVAALFK